MSVNQYVRYNAPVIDGTSGSEPNSVMERGPDSDSELDILTVDEQLVVGGVVDFKGKAVSSSQTVDSSVTFYEVDASGGAVVLTLPAVSAVKGRVFVLNKTDSSGNAATFKGAGSENINAANTISTTTQWAAIRIRANTAGTGWISF